MVWLIGSTGLLGSEIARQLTEKQISWVGTDSSDVDITKPNELDAFSEANNSIIKRTGKAAEKGTKPNKITWVINCAAYTNVDEAEDNAEKVKAINEDGARNIARTTRKIGAKLIHITTDYVFNGKKGFPYDEDDKKSPLNVYGTTKAEGETAVEKEITQYYIIRTSRIYGPNKPCFVKNMMDSINSLNDVKFINDQKFSPTSASDLAAIIIKIIMTSAKAQSLFGKNSAIPYGVYNFSSSGEATPFDCAKKIYELGKKYKKITQTCSIKSCSTEEYGQKALRPMYSVLNNEKIQKALKIKIPSWEDSLEKYIKTM